MNFNGYEIICDNETTNKYHDIYNEPCQCSECILFRKLFNIKYPEICKLLNDFGININFPLEIMDSGINENTFLREYTVYYSVKGELPVSKIESKINNVSITLRNWEIANEAYGNTGMEKPYFIIEIDNISLKDNQAAFLHVCNIEEK